MESTDLLTKLDQNCHSYNTKEKINPKINIQSQCVLRQ